VAPLATAYVRIRPEMGTFQRETETKLSSIGSRLKTVGFAAAAGGALALGAALKSSVNVAGNFDSIMRQVQATTGVSKKSLGGLSDFAIKMGQDTVFSAQEAGDAMLELAKGGMSAAQIKGGGLKETLRLAAAGGLKLADASTYMVQGMTSFGLKAKDAGQVSTALAGAANASTASVHSLGFALSAVGPIAKTMGLSIQETTASLALFDNAGLKGNDAGTSLKTFLSRLVPMTDKAKGTMEDLGLSFTNAAGDMKSLPNIVEQLHDKLGGLSQSRRQYYLYNMFGSDAIRAANLFTDSGAKGLAKFTKATYDTVGANKQATARMGGFKGAMESFNGSVETLQVQIGRFLLPVLETLTRKATGWLNTIGKALSGKGPHAAALKSFTDGFKRLGVVISGAFRHFVDADLPAIIGGLKSLGSAIADAYRQFIDGAGGQEHAAAAFTKMGTTTLPALTGAVKDAGGVLKFLGSHIDAIAKYGLPLLAAGFVLLKTKQIASNTVGKNSVLFKGFEIAANLSLALSNRSLAGAISKSSLATEQHRLLSVKDRLATIASFIAQKAAAAASKGLAAAQWLVNAALSANPIGLVIALVAALAVGLIYAYKHSDTFRRIVDGAFRAVAAAGKWMWEKVLKPAFASLVDAFKLVMRVLGNLRGVFASVFSAVRQVVLDAIRFIVRTFTDGVGTILDSAASITRFVPGLGPKLRQAADEFRAFAAKVNAHLAAIKDEPVNISLGATGAAAKYIREGKSTWGHRLATGGAVRGAGGPTADRVPLWGSNGEHMISAREVTGAGGHAAVEAQRDMWRHAARHANGGRVGLRPIVDAPNETVLRKLQYGAEGVQDSVAHRLGDHVAKVLSAKIAAAIPGPGNGGSVMPGGWARPISAALTGTMASYPGHTGDDFAAALGTPIYAAHAGRVNEALDWNYSYGRHIKIGHGGGIETLYAHMLRRLVGPGAVVKAGQRIGLVDSSGNSTGNHLHFETRVGGRPVEPRTFMGAHGVHFDRGGLARGRGVLPKASPLPERVLSPQQTRSFERLVDVMDKRSGGERHDHVHYHAVTLSEANFGRLSRQEAQRRAVRDRILDLA